jgi:hypothetical protein
MRPDGPGANFQRECDGAVAGYSYAAIATTPASIGPADTGSGLLHRADADAGCSVIKAGAHLAKSREPLSQTEPALQLDQMFALPFKYRRENMACGKLRCRQLDYVN